jgi:hypothetical protein
MTSNPVWPLPQELALRDDALSLTKAVLLAPTQGEPIDLAPIQLLADMLADDFGIAVPIVRGACPKGAVPIEIAIAGRPGAGEAPADLPGAEGYVLKVTAEGATAMGRDVRGAQHAVATLIQLAERREGEVVVRGAEVRDWPHKPIRMVHLYLPGSDHLGYARRYLRDFLVRYKFNGIFIEVGGGVRLRRHPEIPVGWRRFVNDMSALGDLNPVHGHHAPLGPGRRCQNSIHTHLADGRYIEPDELAQLFDWARAYHLDPVPEIQSLAHVYYLACTHRNIAEIQETPFPDAYCPSNPESYELLFETMSEYIELTKCQSVNIGHDEWRAAGLCPKCRTRDTGELFAEDVIRISSWLAGRDQGIWMWGDHLVPGHNANGRDTDDGQIRYLYPQTRCAGKMIAEAAPHITILNWSWSYGEEQADRVVADLGFRQIYGNFDGLLFGDWAKRSVHPSVLGASVSSWSAWNDYELGMMHYPPALYGINLMWSSQWPDVAKARELAARQHPKVRDRMRRLWERPRLWSQAPEARGRRTVPLHGACNARLKTELWDLTGIRRGPQEHEGVLYGIIDAAGDEQAAVVVERLHRPASEFPHQSRDIPIGGRYGSLIFWQAATEQGANPPHTGDGTHYPRESAELLGWYEITFADGLTRAAEIRFGENVQAWDRGYGSDSWHKSHQPMYHALEVPAGVQPDGRPLIIWGLEWTNPRPAIPIESVVLRGAGAVPETRPEHFVSNARPMLLGITGIELPTLDDYRHG